MDNANIGGPTPPLKTNTPTITRVYTPDPDAQLRALTAILQAAQRAKTTGVHTPVGGGSNS